MSTEHIPQEARNNAAPVQHSEFAEPGEHPEPHRSVQGSPFAEGYEATEEELAASDAAAGGPEQAIVPTSLANAANMDNGQPSDASQTLITKPAVTEPEEEQRFGQPDNQPFRETVEDPDAKPETEPTGDGQTETLPGGFGGYDEGGDILGGDAEPEGDSYLNGYATGVTQDQVVGLRAAGATQDEIKGINDAVANRFTGIAERVARAVEAGVEAVITELEKLRVDLHLGGTPPSTGTAPGTS